MVQYNDLNHLLYDTNQNNRSIIIHPIDSTRLVLFMGTRTVIIILVLPPGVACPSNCALPMPGTADGDVVSIRLVSTSQFISAAHLAHLVCSSWLGGSSRSSRLLILARRLISACSSRHHRSSRLVSLVSAHRIVSLVSAHRLVSACIARLGSSARLGLSRSSRLIGSSRLVSLVSAHRLVSACIARLGSSARLGLYR